MRSFFISLSIFVLISNFSSSEVIEFTNAKYSGEVVDGKEHGYGVLTYDSGTIYKGEFKNGKKDGYGEFKWASGNIYKGQFKNDTCEGSGKWIEKDSFIYIGSLIDCELQGLGKIYFLNSRDTYWGAFANNLREGLGYYKSRKHEYYGYWADDKRHGFGVFLDDEDDIWVGEFINGKNIEGKWIPNSEYKKWYLRLQEGRKLANKHEENVVSINNLLEVVDIIVEKAILASGE